MGSPALPWVKQVYDAVYDAFGLVLGATTDAAIDSLFGYTGRPLDEATGLQNNHHRWYDATTGKWLSQDPIGFAAGDANLYRYVGNGPGNARDPSGLEEEGKPGWAGPTPDLLNEVAHYGRPRWAVINVNDQRVLNELYRSGEMHQSPKVFAEASVRAMGPGGVNVVVIPDGYGRWLRERRATTVTQQIPVVASCAEIYTGVKYGDKVRIGFGVAGLGLEVLPIGIVRLVNKLPLSEGVRTVTQRGTHLPLEVGNPAKPINASYFRAVREAVNGADGFYDVIGHGSPTHLAPLDAHPQTAAQVAMLLENADDYVAGTPVRLVACWTGARENGFAQQLANTLGVQVRAANNIVAVDKAFDGGIKVINARLKVRPNDLIDLPPGWYDFFPKATQ